MCHPPAGACRTIWNCARCWRRSRRGCVMDKAKDAKQGLLLEALEGAERQARWESVPAADRERAVQALARLLLRAAGGEHEGAGTDRREASA